MSEHLTSDQIAALAWDVAGDPESAAWRAHLASCAECRAALSSDRALLGQLAAFDAPAPSLPRWDAMVRSALEDVRPTPLPIPHAASRSAAPRAPRFRAWGLRTAALFAVFLVGYHVGVNRAFRDAERVDDPQQPVIHAPLTPAVYHPLAPSDSTLTTSSTKSRYLMVRAEDRPC